MDVQNQINQAKEFDRSGREATGAGNFGKAAECFDKAAGIYQGIDDRINQALQLFNQGGCYQALKKSDQALDVYKKSYDLMKDNEKLMEYQAMILNNLGHLYVSIKDYEQAFSSFEKACGVYEAIKDENGKAFQLQNMGSVHRDLQESDKALGLYFQSIAGFEKTGNRHGEADQCTNIAYIYAVDKNAEEALKWYKRALGIYVDIHESQKADLTQKNIDQLERLKKKF